MARVYISCAEQDLDLSVRIKDWLRFQDYDPISLEGEARSATSHLAQWHKKYAQALEQCDLVILVLTPEWVDSKWCFAEFTEAFSLGKTIYAVVEKPLTEDFTEPGISIFDLTVEREEGLAQLAEALRGTLSNATEGLDFDPARSVYPGLRAFEDQDGSAYFCRRDDIRKIIDRLNTRRRQGGTSLLALLGATGTGVSSLMMAGVLPKIQRDQESWIVLPPMRPRLCPIEEFCRSIAKLLDNEDMWRQWAELFRGNDFKGIAREMADELRERLNRPNAHILISIDQAEELFSISDPEDAQQFLDVLGAILDDDMPYEAVAALRPDFLKEFQTSDQLSHVIEEFSPALMPLSAIREIITSPAELIQLEIEDDLVDEILSDALQEGALPLVALVLNYLYENHGNSGALTLEAYRSIGSEYAGNTPLGNLIAKLAEQILEDEAPNDAQLFMLEELFAKKLLWRDNDNRYVPVPASMDEFNFKTREYIRKFIEAGLLVPVHINGHEMVEYTHLSILEYWPRLIEWVNGVEANAQAKVAQIGNSQAPQLTYEPKNNADVIEPDEITSPRDFSFQGEKDNGSDFISETHDYVHGEIIEPKSYANSNAQEEENLSRTPSIYADQEDRFAKATYSDRSSNPTYTEDVQGIDGGRDVPGIFTRDNIQEKSEKVLSKPGADTGYADGRYDDEGSTSGIAKFRYLFAAVVLGGTLAAGLVYWPQIEPHIKALVDKGLETAQTKTPEVPVKKVDTAPKKEEKQQVVNTSSSTQQADVEKVEEISEKLDPRFIGHKLDSNWPFLKVANAFEVLNSRDQSSTQRLKAQENLAANLLKMKSALKLKGHSAPIRHISFGPKGVFLATASEDQTVKVWDILTGTNVLTLIGHSGPVNSVSFSSDGAQILTASDDGTAKLWNSHNGEVIRTITEHEQAVKWAVFDMTGERIATASLDKKAHIWNSSDGTRLYTLKGHEAGINAIEFSRNGNWLATASQDKTARIWDAASGQEIVVLRGHKASVRSVKFSNDSTQVLTGSDDLKLITWRTFSGKQDKVFSGHENAIASMDFSPDEDVMISTSINGEAILWGTKEKSVLSNIKKRQDDMRVAAFSKKGKWIASATNANTVHLIPAEFYITSKVFEGHTDRVFSSVFSQDGRWVLTASRDATARIWNVEKNSQEKLLSGHIGQIHHAIFSPQREIVATAGKDKTVRIWSLKTGREIHVLEGAGGAINKIAYNHDGTLIVGASHDKNAYVWNVETGHLLHALSGHKGFVWSALFSKDGRKIYTASDDKEVKVWDTNTGELSKTLTGHKGSVLSLALTDDGKILASGATDMSVRFWDTEAEEKTGKVLQHNGFITSVAFNAAGDKVITGSFNKKAVVWNRNTGKVLWEIDDHDDRVMSVDFTEEGNWALTASADKALMWRVLSPPEMLFYVKSVLPRCLIEEERKKLKLIGDKPAWCKQVEELREQH